MWAGDLAFVESEVGRHGEVLSKGVTDLTCTFRGSLTAVWGAGWGRIRRRLA